MPPHRQQGVVPAVLAIDLSMDEILEDLCAPGPPPGSWDVPGREHAHVDALLREIERGVPAAS